MNEKSIAVIIAQSVMNPDVSASATIHVVQLATSITLNYTEYALERGMDVQLVATIKPANVSMGQEVKWTTSNEDVVMVNNSGRCVCLSEGEAIVTATTCDGSNLSASCVFSCTDGILSIANTADSPDIEFYTTDGRRMERMRTGVNILRTDDGRTVKMLKKPVEYRAPP